MKLQLALADTDDGFLADDIRIRVEEAVLGRLSESEVTLSSFSRVDGQQGSHLDSVCYVYGGVLESYFFFVFDRWMA